MGTQRLLFPIKNDGSSLLGIFRICSLFYYTENTNGIPLISIYLSVSFNCILFKGE